MSVFFFFGVSRGPQVVDVDTEHSDRAQSVKTHQIQIGCRSLHVLDHFILPRGGNGVHTLWQ